MSDNLHTEHLLQKVLNILLVIFFIWWIAIQIFVTDTLDIRREIFSASYGTLALVGGIAGILVANKWGGFKSIIGTAILMFSLGLLLQEFGQLAYSYYSVIQGIEIPYPSWGDLGYSGSIPCYIYGTYLLGRAAGATYKDKKVSKLIISIIIPICILLVSYYLLISKQEMNAGDVLANILNVAYPLGQAIYISLALHMYLLASDFLGGKMKYNIKFVMVALVLQYIADFVFLYLNIQGTWVTAGTNELMYLLAYFLMSTSLIMIGETWVNLKFPGKA